MDLSVSHSGTIITCYSYKGGTGRSMAVANIACLLAQRVGPSQRILVMDWDLEAPGLHRFFAPQSEQAENINRPGCIDYFYALRRLLAETADLYEELSTPGGWKTLEEMLPLNDYLISDVVPGIDLMKAGQLLDQQYAERVSSFDWAEFYDQFGSAMEAFRDLLRANYAYCLIDSRTGFTDISGICTMFLPEKLVAVFTPNRQSLYGLPNLVARAVEYRRASDDFRPLAVFPLPSRIELTEEKLRNQWREEYQRTFEDLFRQVYEIAECDLSAYFEEVLLPHVSDYAYGERIAVLEEERGDVLSLSRRYEEFCERLIELDFAWEALDHEAAIPITTAPRIRPTAETGKELERHVADAYRAMGAWKVEHDVELAGNQIDVYVELETPDRGLHRVVVEVKHSTKPIGVDAVQGFAHIMDLLRRGRLVDTGVIVSASGFTGPARNTAEIYDIRLLELADLETMVAAARPVEPSLPFDKLSPRDFERLCLWLVEREGYERAEHLGAVGSEQGRDIIAWRGDQLWAFQCKQVRSFGLKDALKEIEKVLALPEDQRPVRLVFLVTSDVAVNTRQQVRERLAGQIECHFWAGTEFDERVKRHRDIVEEFFQIVFSLADRLPKPKDPPIPSNELFKADPIPRFTCRQSTSEIHPQADEEVQVRLLVTNESQIKARNVHVSLQLPPGYVGVAPYCDLHHHQDVVGPYGHFSLVRVIRATVENANPTVNLTITYLYGKDGRVEEQSIQAAPTSGGELLGDLINQDQIITHLQSWLEELRPGQSLFTLLGGELGVGKTRVLQHVIQVARQREYYVFHTTCPRSIDLNRPDPLPSMLERGLRQLTSDATLDQMVRGIAGHADYTPMVVAVTTYLGHPIPGTSDFWDQLGQEGRDRWIARFIAEFSKYKPVFIAVDDLDHAPISTLRLLRCIADEAEAEADACVRILVTLNPRAKHLSDDLLKELDTITSHTGRWTVPRLEKVDDIQELIKQVYNRPPPPGWAEELHKLCQGNPSLVLEVLQLLERKGKLVLRQGHWEFAGEPLKPLLDQVLQQKEEEITIDKVLKARLPDPDDVNSYRFLQVMAILGRELEFENIDEFVRENAGLSDDDFEQAEEQLRHLGVLAETTEGLWTITPPILYEAVMDSLSASRSRLRRLHRNAAEYLKDKYKGQREWAAKIAYHFHQAGRSADAFEYLLKAAKWEESRKDFWRTVGLYEWALEDWPEEYPPEEEGRLRLYLSNLYETLGEYESAQEHLAGAYCAFERAGDGRGKVEARIQQGWMAHLQQSDHQALEIYELAQEELDSLPEPHPQSQRRLWRYHGVSAIRTGQLEKGDQLIMRAIDVAQHESDYNELANIHLDVSLSYFKQEMWEEALEQYDLGEKALERFENIDDFKVKAKLVASKATVHLRQHKDDQALAEYQEAIKLAREITYPDVEAGASFGLGVLYQERGDLDQAIRYLTYSARTSGRLKKLEATKNAYEELLKTLHIAERWDQLLYEAAYAKRCHALSPLGRVYALSALSHSGKDPAEYPDLFDSVPEEPQNFSERRITE